MCVCAVPACLRFVPHSSRSFFCLGCRVYGPAHALRGLFKGSYNRPAATDPGKSRHGSHGPQKQPWFSALLPLSLSVWLARRGAFSWQDQARPRPVLCERIPPSCLFTTQGCVGIPKQKQNLLLVVFFCRRCLLGTCAHSTGRQQRRDEADSSQWKLCKNEIPRTKLRGESRFCRVSSTHSQK